MKDALGRELKLGDQVAYKSSSRSSWLCWYRVVMVEPYLTISDKERSTNGYHDEKRIKEPKNVVKLEPLS